MLKFLHIVQIFNFHTFLANFSSYFKDIVLSYLDELLDLPYMIEKLETFSFHYNLNHIKIPLVDPDISQTVYKDLV